MQSYQKEFIELARGHDVLRFGEFTLKSGRVSPYFFNAGLFASGAALAALGRCYADRIVDSGVEFDVLLGRKPGSGDVRVGWCVCVCAVLFCCRLSCVAALSTRPPQPRACRRSS